MSFDNSKGRVANDRQQPLAALSWRAFAVFALLFAAHLIPNLALRLEFEDQLIVLRYARNLAEGNGLVYNAGERVMGFTTPLFTLLSSLFVLLGGEQAPAWQNTFGLLCMLGTAAVAARLLVNLGVGAAAPLAVALVTFNPAAAYNYLHVGMEVHLFALLFLLALDLQLRGRSTGASIVAALLFLTRPEGALLIIMLLASTWLRERRPPLRDAFAWGVTVAPWLAFATIYYGSPIPATLPAKRGALFVHTMHYLERVGEIYADAATSVAATYKASLMAAPLGWLPLALLAVTGAAVLLRRRPEAWPLFAFPTLSVVGYGALGSWAEFTWHYYPLSVLGALAVAAGAFAAATFAVRAVLEAARRIGTFDIDNPELHRWAVLAFLLAISFPIGMSTWRQANHRVEPSPRGEGLASMGRALDERFGGTVSVLLDEIGHIGWEARIRIVDQAGLVTPGLRYDVPRPLVVERHRPDLLLLHDDAPSRHGVKQTARFPFDAGYHWVTDFPAAPDYRLYEFSGSTEAEQDTAPSQMYRLRRGESGHIEALVFNDHGDFGTNDRVIPIAGSGDSTTGYIEQVTAESDESRGTSINSPFVVTGWAADTSDPAGITDVVVVSGDRVVAASHAGLVRPDVAAELGRPFRYTGFSATAYAEPERVEREGFVVYAVSRRGVARRLRFLYQPLPPLEPEGPGDQRLLVTDGRRLPVREPGDGYAGLVDVRRADGRTEIAGWSADLERGERPRQIVIYRDGQFLASLGLTRERPDVVERYGDPRLQRTGFGGPVPGTPDPKTFASSGHRVFAIMLRGAAVELPYPALPAQPQ